jgi:hypothetical protein
MSILRLGTAFIGVHPCEAICSHSCHSDGAHTCLHLAGVSSDPIGHLDSVAREGVRTVRKLGSDSRREEVRVQCRWGVLTHALSGTRSRNSAAAALHRPSIRPAADRVLWRRERPEPRREPIRKQNRLTATFLLLLFFEDSVSRKPPSPFFATFLALCASYQATKTPPTPSPAVLKYSGRHG